MKVQMVVAAAAAMVAGANAECDSDAAFECFAAAEEQQADTCTDFQTAVNAITTCLETTAGGCPDHVTHFCQEMMDDRSAECSSFTCDGLTQPETVCQTNTQNAIDVGVDESLSFIFTKTDEEQAEDETKCEYWQIRYTAALQTLKNADCLIDNAVDTVLSECAANKAASNCENFDCEVSSFSLKDVSTSDDNSASGAQASLVAVVVASFVAAFF